MNTQQLAFTTPSVHQHLTIFRHEQAPQRKLMLLHGAGVGGQLTWTFLANYLTQWDEIYVPDLAGMGSSYFLANEQPQLADYQQQIDELLAYLKLDYTELDFAGYSFGGMLLESWLRDKPFAGLVFLIEPAMLFSAEPQQLLAKSQQYQQIAQQLALNPLDQNTYLEFLDSVSPNRLTDSKADQLTIQRLQNNPQGMSQALQAITQQLNQQALYYSQWCSPWRGASFVGDLSLPSMHQRHLQLAATSSHWAYHSIAKADHSLVFTRPRSIATLFNSFE